MIQNWPIHPVKAHHFQGPVSENGNGYRTIPELLRAIADWMDANDVKDGEFFDLTFAKSFTTHDEDDDVQQVATVYYMEEGG